MRLHNRIGLSTELAEAVLNLDEARAEALKEQGADIKARVLGPLISSIPLNELGRDRMCSIAGPFSDEVSVTVLGQIIHDIYTDKSNLTLKIRCALLALDLGADIKADAICR